MKLRDYALIGGLLVVVIVLFIFITFFGDKPGSIAKVYQANQVVLEVDFIKKEVVVYPQIGHETYPKISTPVSNEGGDLAYIILGAYVIEDQRTEVFIEIDWDLNKIRIQRDDTPRQIGVSRDWYDGTGLPAISLPSEVFIIFEKEVPYDGIDGNV